MSVGTQQERIFVDDDISVMTRLRLERIELYVLMLGGSDSEIDDRGSLPWRCGLLRIRGGGYEGWGTCTISSDCERFDIVKWAAFLHQIKSLPAEAAFLEAERKRESWGNGRTELVLKTLMHLKERTEKGYALPASDDNAVLKRAEAYYDVLF